MTTYVDEEGNLMNLVTETIAMYVCGVCKVIDGDWIGFVTTGEPILHPQEDEPHNRIPEVDLE